MTDDLPPDAEEGLSRICAWCQVQPEILPEMPENGAALLCDACGRISVWDGRLGLRRPTRDEALALIANPDIIDAVVGWSQEHRRVPGELS